MLEEFERGLNRIAILRQLCDDKLRIEFAREGLRVKTQCGSRACRLSGRHAGLLDPQRTLRNEFSRNTPPRHHQVQPQWRQSSRSGYGKNHLLSTVRCVPDIPQSQGLVSLNGYCRGEYQFPTILLQSRRGIYGTRPYPPQLRWQSR